MTEQPVPVEVRPDTLELVYDESKVAYDRLMDDLAVVSQRFEGSAQLSLVILGITVALLGSVSVGELDDLTKALLLVGVGLLIVNPIYVLATTIYSGRVYSGTIFPDVLYNRLNKVPDDVKLELMKVLAESYYFNHQLLLQRGREVTTAQALQLVGFVFLLLGAFLVIF